MFALNNNAIHIFAAYKCLVYISSYLLSKFKEHIYYKYISFNCRSFVWPVLSVCLFSLGFAAIHDQSFYADSWYISITASE